MVKRFRMIAGPNGSGKSTLVKRLQDEYRVNFYTFVNADEIFAQVLRTRSIAQLRSAMPYLSRAFFFDNSGADMRFLGQYSADAGYALSMSESRLPRWFVEAIG